MLPNYLICQNTTHINNYNINKRKSSAIFNGFENVIKILLPHCKY